MGERLLLVVIIFIATGTALQVQPRVQRWWDRHPPKSEPVEEVHPDAEA